MSLETPTHYICDFCFEVSRIGVGLTFYCKKCKGKLWRFKPESEQPETKKDKKSA